MQVNRHAITRRARFALPWLGIVLFGGIAIVAALHLTTDAWRVLIRIDSLASLRVALTAGAVIAAGAALTLVLTWMAGTSARRATIAAVAAFIALVVIRVTVAYAYDGVLSGEPGVYDSQAVALAAGKCCPWDEPIDRPPGFQFVLGGLYAVFGRSALTAEALNMIMAMATGLVVFRLARGLYGPQVGVVALLLYALWPAGALMIGVRVPHTAYDLAIIATTWVSLSSPPGWRGSALGGALLGLSQYFRPTSLLLLPVFILARLWRGGAGRSMVRDTLIPMTLMTLVVLLPVLAWNLSTRGAVDLSTSAYAGSSAYHGTNIERGGRWSKQASKELVALAGDDHWDRSRVGQALAIERLREDPVGIISLAIRKQNRLWGRETFGVRYGIRRDLATRPYLPRSVVPSLASGAFYAAVMAFAALGLYLRRRKADALAMLVILTALMLTLMHGFVEVRDRYHSYVIPMLIPIAALAVAAVTNRLTKRPDGADEDSNVDGVLGSG